MIQVMIDPDAGFCFGVEKAIELAEKELAKHGKLNCLGDIVHNTAELERLKTLGLQVIKHEELSVVENQPLLFRAHGEPPASYEAARSKGIGIIDASCPIVLKLQEKIRKQYQEEKQVQIIIFGKPGHPEIVGLQGQTNGEAIIVHKSEDLDLLDYSKPVRLYSQTTMSYESYQHMAELVQAKMNKAGNTDLVINKSYCRQVSGRTQSLKAFASNHDLIIFVSDKKSSNGEFLYNVCRSVNPNSKFIHGIAEMHESWFANVSTVGITGATSTPKWLMDNVAEAIENGIFDENE